MMKLFRRVLESSSLISTILAIQALEEGDAMLLAVVYPASGDFKLTALQTHSRATGACDVTVLQMPQAMLRVCCTQASWMLLAMHGVKA